MAEMKSNAKKVEGARAMKLKSRGARLKGAKPKVGEPKAKACDESSATSEAFKGNDKPGKSNGAY